MAPNPQTEPIHREIHSENFTKPSGDEIVISGMSGIFPKSANTLEFMENLFNKVNMVEEVTEDVFKHPNLPKHMGKIKGHTKFDAQFFRVTHWQANTLDIMTRKLMECAYSAIYDSGTNPLSVSGSRLGVFIGSSYSDAVVFHMYAYKTTNHFAVSGGSKTMQANRISYWIDGKGPSVSIDQACSSSMACLELAYNSIKRGDCDYALVGGCNTCVHPKLSLALKNAGHLCLDGKTKSFDKNGDGYVRSEAISMVFLQKAKDAKRIYSEICHIKSKFFIDDLKGIRKSDDIEKFLQEFYSDLKMSPSEVEYIEAFGLGIAEADANELDAIGNIFAKSRPIKIGSIKSNMGHTESVSGLCALTKLCLSYNKGELPGNLHYNEPLDHVHSVRDGRIKVLTENSHFNRGYTAFNSFSYTGANYHVLLKGNNITKDKTRYRSNIPYLILLSGRQEQGVKKIMEVLENQPIDPEEIALIHNIHKTYIPGHTGRSYTILETNAKNETVGLAKHFEFYSGTRKPVWYLYSGMGSQWCGMGTELMRIPIFAATIQKCHQILSPFGVDVKKIITESDKSIFDNIINSMVGITVVQIGLTDVLTAIGISPDGIIGHSLGELACAYADGSLSAEEALTASYLRGVSSLEAPLIRGSMAAVGLGYKDVIPLCPPEIDVACHNSDKSATISGPAEAMATFVSELTKRGIFAREVPCSNISYHSRYMQIAGPVLLLKMQNLIKNPKQRSQKWISTSVLRENWDTEQAKYASAEYFTNNLLNPVYFEENGTSIPNDAIVIEIAPHGLLQAIVKKSLNECINIPLTKRNTADPITFLLSALGKLHETGLNLQIGNLYPPVEFPVSIETPLLSNLVEWEHSEDWDFKIFDPQIVYTSARNVVGSVHDDDYKVLEGHIRNGLNEFSESGLLVLVWETLGMSQGKNYKDMSVNFSYVTFHNQIKIDSNSVFRLRITLEHSSRFEVLYGTELIVTGFIIEINKIVPFENQVDISTDYNIDLDENTFYALMSMNGYSYSGGFQSIYSFDTKTNSAYIKNTDNWTILLDSLIQIKAFSNKHDGVSIPKIITNLSIHVNTQKNESPVILSDGTLCYKAQLVKSNSVVRCAGVELAGIVFDDKLKQEKHPDVVLTKVFVPHIKGENMDLRTVISVNLQLVNDNIVDGKIRIAELVTSSSESILKVITEVIETLPFHTYETNNIKVLNNFIDKKDFFGIKLLVVHNLCAYKKTLIDIDNNIDKNVFILTLDKNVKILTNELNYETITTIPIGNKVITLLKKGNDYDTENVIYVPIDFDKTFSWVSRVQSELGKSRRVVLVSEGQPYCGLLDFVKHLRKHNENKIGAVIIEDYNRLLFNPNNDMYKNYLKKNLCLNVWKKGHWGSYYYIQNLKSIEAKSVSLTSNTFKDFNSWTWLENCKPSKNAVQVCYAGVSMKDCQQAMNKINIGSSLFGMDFSGVNSNGQKVMGLVPSGAISNTVEADTALIWPIPQHWSLADGATVPLAYVHAYYCLFLKGEISRGQRVFVSGGAGAFGQAVISICISLGCPIFTTVSSENKKRFLLKIFPELKEDDIASSLRDSFYTIVRNIGRCEIVINCGNEHFQEAAMKCVSPQGKFLDVSHVNMRENKEFGMSYLWEQKNYLSVDVSSIFMQNKFAERKILQTLVADGIANGAVRPLSRVIYLPTELSRAFNLVSNRQNRGRTLMKMENFNVSCSNVNILPRMTYSNGTHVVVCDRANLGVELIDHLINNGVKYIVAHLKSYEYATYLSTKFRFRSNINFTLEINSENLATSEGCVRLLKTAGKMSSVAGIYIVQEYKGKLNDVISEQSNYESSFRETVTVTNNLDIASRNIGNALSNFVVISVSSSNLSNEYAASACESICEARRKLGLPGLVIRTCTFNQEITSETELLSKLTLATVSALFNGMGYSLKLNESTMMAFNKCKRNNKRILEIQNKSGVKEEEINTQQYIKSRGLSSWYNKIENDEINAVDLFVTMNTLSGNMEEFGLTNRLEPYLLMIPGFEGYHDIFTSIAERLKIGAATIQLGPDLIFNSIPDIANNLAKHIKSNFTISSHFYILGYSFGVNVALEIAKILEAEGLTGTVYCLDSSPDSLKEEINAYIGNLTDNQLQNTILEHIYHLMTSENSVDLQLALENANSFSDKVEICLRQLRGKVHFSFDHQKSLLQSAYNRIILAKEYKPELKLKSKLVLIKSNNSEIVNLDNEYNLSKYTIQPVNLFSIESDHVEAPYDCKVSNIVNKMLDHKIVEDFSRKNVCEYYCQQ